MNSSTSIGVSGASPQNVISRNTPVDSKITMFVMHRINGMLYYKFHSNIAMYMLYVYIQGVTNDVWDLL
jgi:hypothetical protein